MKYLPWILLVSALVACQQKPTHKYEMAIMQTMPDGVETISLGLTDLRHNIMLFAAAYENGRFPQVLKWDYPDEFTAFDKVRIELDLYYQDKRLFPTCDITGQKGVINRVSVVFDGTEQLKCTVEPRK